MCRFRWPSRFAARAARETTRLASQRAVPYGALCHPAQKDEAPPCMRWRGLASPTRPWWPVARLPCATRLPLAACRAAESPVSRASAPPGVASGVSTSSVVKQFYRCVWPGHKAFGQDRRRKFSRPQDICRLSPVRLRFPPVIHTTVHSGVGFAGAPQRRQRPLRSAPATLEGTPPSSGPGPAGRTISSGHRQGARPGGHDRAGPEPGPGPGAAAGGHRDHRRGQRPGWRGHRRQLG
jgi:hypothetical protein